MNFKHLYELKPGDILIRTFPRKEKCELQDIWESPSRFIFNGFIANREVMPRMFSHQRDLFEVEG